MTQSLLERIFRLEENDELHLLRILILLDTLAGDNQKQEIDGINKMVKLDFLLRYPIALERALTHIGKSKNVAKIDIKDYERESVESKLMHFQYGPWDSRYRRFLAVLEAKGLIKMVVKGVTVKICVTTSGHLITQRSSELIEFKDYVIRSKLIKTNFNKFSPKALIEFYYTVFPEMVTMKQGEKIIL
jgi:hypothetical protein